jgi:hypothetical protein
MPTNVRYYITKADDQPVVRSVPVARPRMYAAEPRRVDEPRPEAAAKPSVTALLRHALRRKQDVD